MPGAITREEVRRMAALARLALDEDETDLFGRQLAQVLAYARQIATVLTADVPATARVLADAPLERDDRPRPALSPADALANAPDPAPDATLFRTPWVFGA